MTSLPSAVVAALRNVLGAGSVQLHEPCFDEGEREAVLDCLNSTFVSSVGKYVDKFESGLAEFTGARHAIAVSNGTAALHVALLLAGVEPGDEVLVPALTFVATANAVAYCGAVPHFVDSEEETLGLDPTALRDWLSYISEPSLDGVRNRLTGRRIRAVVPMHTFGHPVRIDELMSVAAKFKLMLIEDSAESLGSSYRGRHTGTFGLLGTLSFNGNKTITTGGGGALLTDNDELARTAKHITTTAKRPHRWEYMHDQIAYNYRMPNINAALGCAQLEKLPSFLSSKRSLFKRYSDAFSGINEGRVFEEPKGSVSNYWLQTLVLSVSAAHQRDAILSATNDEGLMTRPVWTLMHRLPAFQACQRAPLLVSESLERRIINLPSSAGLA